MLIILHIRKILVIFCMNEFSNFSARIRNCDLKPVTHKITDF